MASRRKEGAHRGAGSGAIDGCACLHPAAIDVVTRPGDGGSAQGAASGFTYASRRPHPP